MRLFIAIPIPKDLKKELEKFQKEQIVRNVRWTSPKNFHITVQFLGEVEKRHLKEIEKRLKDTAKCVRAFDLVLKNISYTGPDIVKEPPPGRMVWAIFEGDGEYKKLAATAIGKLRDISDEYPWGEDVVHKEKIPHITLGRFAPYSSKHHVSELKKTNMKERRIHVDSFELWESKIASRGATYNSLARFKI